MYNFLGKVRRCGRKANSEAEEKTRPRKAQRRIRPQNPRREKMERRNCSKNTNRGSRKSIIRPNDLVFKKIFRG